MIEYVRGSLFSVDGSHVVVDVGGLGYGLNVPRSTLQRLPEDGAEVELRVSMIVREDAMELYGFATPEERGVFDILRNVSGVGPRTALDLLSTLSIREVIGAVQAGNVDMLTSVPGIGPKKARRAILELKDRVKDILPFATGDAPSLEGAARLESADAAGSGGEPDLFQDAVAALQALGVKPAVASRNVASALRAAGDGEVSVEELVRLALQAGR